MTSYEETRSIAATDPRGPAPVPYVHREGVPVPWREGRRSVLCPDCGDTFCYGRGVCSPGLPPRPAPTGGRP